MYFKQLHDRRALGSAVLCSLIVDSVCAFITPAQCSKYSERQEGLRILSSNERAGLRVTLLTNA
jgi:hypothetical protein